MIQISFNRWMDKDMLADADSRPRLSDENE